MRQKKIVFSSLLFLCSASALAQEQGGTQRALRQLYDQAQRLVAQKKYAQAATLYFNVYVEPESRLKSAALAGITESLIRAGFPNAATYFYIKTLQSGVKPSIRRILNFLPYMLDRVGGDVLRKYIVQNTTEADYNPTTRSHFYYFLGKDELLKGNPGKALEVLRKVDSISGMGVQVWYLKGTAYAMLNQPDQAVQSFQACKSKAADLSSSATLFKTEAEDIEARCTAGLARTYYQAQDYGSAEETYDLIPKTSFVWTDILFEQAWNAFAKEDYNRALGKLVTYRSPALNFVFNPEVEVLRAQSFFALCYYDEVNKTVNEFHAKYGGVGERIKSYLETNDQNLKAFYLLARQVFREKLHSQDMLKKALNRFIRGPYFASLVLQERLAQQEADRLRFFAENAPDKPNQLFAQFLRKVVSWRQETIQLLGGMYVKNSMIDLYNNLLENLDRMAFIRLEMLSKYKAELQSPAVMSEDEDGNMKKGADDIDRKDYQYFWTFNGEFWLDELGDYVFSLVSQCGNKP